MSKQSLNTLKEWFRRGLKPLQEQFWHWMDSFWHKDEKIPSAQIEGLQELLNAKVDKKDAVDPEQVGQYDPAKDYVFDAARAEYVSFSNAGSSDPQFQVEGFYRLTEDAPAGENPETHPAHWAYQGFTIGEITVDDVVGLREELVGRLSIEHANIMMAGKIGQPMSLLLGYNDKNIFKALSVTPVATESVLQRNGDSNAYEASYFFNIANLSPITFPANTGKVMIEGGAGSWNDEAKVFTPAVNGIFLFEEKKQGDTYYLKVFSESVDGQGTGGGGKSQLIFPLIGHTSIPMAFDIDQKIIDVPKFNNLSGVKLVKSDASEIALVTNGTKENMPVNVGAGDYDIALTYESGKESGTLLVNIE